MSKKREKESLEYVRMDIWALKTQNLGHQIAHFTHMTPLHFNPANLDLFADVGDDF